MKKENSPKGYRTVETCKTCAFVFERSDFDESTTYYCTACSMPRPLCCSVGMNEQAMKDTDYDEWDVWAEKTQVGSNKVCDAFKKKEKSE